MQHGARGSRSKKTCFLTVEVQHARRDVLRRPIVVFSHPWKCGRCGVSTARHPLQARSAAGNRRPAGRMGERAQQLPDPDPRTSRPWRKGVEVAAGSQRQGLAGMARRVSVSGGRRDRRSSRAEGARQGHVARRSCGTLPGCHARHGAAADRLGTGTDLRRIQPGKPARARAIP